MPLPRCPRCHRRLARRVSRKRALDRILAAAYVYPFRCQVCGRRFRGMQWGLRYARRTDDRREYDRLAVELAGLLADAGRRVSVTASDLSLGGCAVRTELRLASRTVVDLTLNPSTARPLLIEGAVVRSVRDGIIGLEFPRLSAEARPRLEALVVSVIGSRPESIDVMAGHDSYLRRRRRARNGLLLAILLAVVVALFLWFPTVQFCRKNVLC